EHAEQEGQSAQFVGDGDVVGGAGPKQRRGLVLLELVAQDHGGAGAAGLGHRPKQAGGAVFLPGAEVGEDESDVGLLGAVVGALGRADFDLDVGNALGDALDLLDDSGAAANQQRDGRHHSSSS